MRNYFMCESCFDRFDSEDDLLIINNMYYCNYCQYSKLKIKAMQMITVIVMT